MKKTNLSFFMALAMISSLFFSCRDPFGKTTNNVTITLDANGGKASDGKTSVTMTAPEGTKINLVDNIFSRTGYTYLGQAKDKDSATIDYADKAEIEFNTDFTLYAIWSKDTLGGVPTEVKASTLNSKPAISWKGVTAATKYIVYINVKNDSASATEYVTLDEEEIELETKYMNTLTVENDVYTRQVSFSNGEGNYYFWVKAANDDEISDFSSVVKLANGTVTAPTGVTVAQSDSIKNKIIVSFEKENGMYYRLYESKTNDFATATLRTKSVSKNQNFTVSEDGTYYFWITRTDGADISKAESDPSEAVSVSFTRDELKTPTETSATLGTDNKTVTVNWTEVDTKKPGKFLLYYIYDSGNPTSKTFTDATLITLDGSATSKKIENLGKGYFYWWILEADDDPTIYADTEKSTVNAFAHTESFTSKS